MAFRHGDKRTSYNGICIWMQKFNDVKFMPTEAKFSYINEIIFQFIEHNNENISKNTDGSINIEKASNLIQTRWNKFKDWYLKARKEIKP